MASDWYILRSDGAYFSPGEYYNWGSHHAEVRQLFDANEIV